MSNLKKILSLVLAVTMILSVAMTSAMAGPFIDVKDDQDYAAAINLLASLEVLLGFEDGSYQPSGTYTREQFAKILYVLMNGKDDKASMYSGASPFPDVAADRWSAGYITWASNLGVINGREDGLFYPTDVVKYAEAAKMFIVAMGYSSSIYSYPYGFIDKAQTLGMFDDLTGYSTFGDANRGTVAQMGYNVLFAEAPRFGTYTTQEGNSTNTNTYTVIEGAFGVKKSSGYYDSGNVWRDYVLVGTSTKAYGAPLYDDDQVAIRVGSSEEVYDYLGDVDEYIGEPVQIWYKPPTDKSTFGTDSDLLLIERLSGVKVYNVNPMDIDTDRSSTESLYFTDGSVTRRMRLPSFTATVGGTSGTYYGIEPIGWDGNNGAVTSTSTDRVAVSKDYMTNLDFYPDSNTQKSAVYKFIDYTGDGILDAVYVDVPDFTKVSSATSTRLSVTTGALAGSKTLKDDDGNTVINVYDGIAKDDRVLVYRSQAVLSGSVEDTYNVVKAEAVKNVKHNSQTSSRYYFDSVRYRLAIDSSSLKLGDAYDIYLNANGYIAEASKVSGSSSGNWIMLTNSAQSKNSVGNLTAASLTGYTADGTKRTYLIDLDEVDKTVYMDGDGSSTNPGTELLDPDDGWNPAGSNGKVAGYGRVFAYTLNNNGEIDSLKHIWTVVNDSDDDALTNYYHGMGVLYDEDTNVLTIAGGGRGYIDGDTVIFNIYGADNDIQILKASDMPDIKDNTSNELYDLGVDSGDVVVASIKSDSKLGTSSNKYGLIISAMEYSASSSKFYYDLTVAVDGEIKTLRTKEVSGTSGSSGISRGNLINGKAIGYAKIELNASGEVNSLTYLDYNAAPAKDDASWVHGAVNTKSSSGRGLGLLAFNSYEYNATGSYYKVNLGSNQDFVLSSGCNFYLVDVNPYASFGVSTTAAAGTLWDETNLSDRLGANPREIYSISYSNDSDDISPATADSMTMTDANNGWMIDVLIENDDGDVAVVAVFIYVNPVRR